MAAGSLGDLQESAAGTAGPADDPHMSPLWSDLPVQGRLELGAHFHKTHGRCAKDRHVVTGTLCQACGVQYWTTGRLARHLRDIPSCVATLRGHGLTVAVRLPGTGSTSRRKAEQADFHPAAPTRQQQPKEELGSSDWDPTQRAAHAGLCDALLVPDLKPDERHLVGLLRATFGAYPLYVDEAKDVLDPGGPAGSPACSADLSAGGLAGAR